MSYLDEWQSNNPVTNEQDMFYDNCFVCGKLCRDVTDEKELPVCAIHNAAIDGPSPVRVRWDVQGHIDNPVRPDLHI